MAGRQAGSARSVVLASGIALGALAGAVLPVTVAAAANKTVQVGNGTSVTIPSGWTAGTPSGGVLDVTHKSPKAVVAIEVETGVTASPQVQATSVFSSLEKQFGLSKVKVMGAQNSTLPATGKFDEAYSFTYTGAHKGQTFGGLVVELQSSKSGSGCFAIALAKQSDKSKLKSGVNQIVNSLASN